MTTFTEADKTYRTLLESPGRELSAAFDAARSVTSVDINGTDITHAILLRLKAFFRCQEQIKVGLGKVYSAPAADFFVETVCFFLKVALEKLDPSLSVASEKSLILQERSIRPDISIWRGEELVAAIECKTQLGWNRNGWLKDFEEREQQLSRSFPHTRLFLLVMTGNNWQGYGNDERVGDQFFVLLNDLWPSRFETSNANAISHSVESLFQCILNHARQGVRGHIVW